jgi:acyl carrier protein
MNGATLEACAGALEAFIRANFQVRDNDPCFNWNVNLWEEGYVDSTGLVEVIAFLEETFRITVPEGVLFSPDFTNIAGISKSIIRLKTADPSTECCSEEPVPLNGRHASPYV